jgi:hypothetical protein
MSEEEEEEEDDKASATATKELRNVSLRQKQPAKKLN